MNNNLPQEKILEVKDLRISFRTGGGTVKAVRGISFSLYKGRTLAIVGESGSGKSVTSKAILGILANNKIVEGGQIIFDGKDLLKLDEAGFSKLRGVKISMIFQDPLSSLNPIMIVGKQLTEEMKLKHKADKRNAKRGLSKLNRYMAKIDPESAAKLVALLKEKGQIERDSLNEFLPLFEKTAEASFLERVEKAKEAITDFDAFVEAVSNSDASSFLETKKLYHPLASKIAHVVLPFTVESDDTIDVFAPLCHGAYRNYTESVRLAKARAQLLEKYGVKDFYDLPPAIRAKQREVIKSELENIEEFALALRNISAYLKRIIENGASPAKEFASKSLDKYFVLIGQSRSKLTAAEAKEKAIKMLADVGIAEPERRYKQYPFELSGGMRQRVVIAIALCSSPEVLICDEPTTALDVTIQSQILELINRLKAEKNLSVVFITHDLGVVANMADDIAVMYAGKIVEYGTSYDIFYDPRHPYTWALLGSMPDLETKEKLHAIPGTPPNMLLPPRGDAFAARNQHAIELDKLAAPPFFTVSPTHQAATWLLADKAPDVEVPAIVRERIEKALKAHPEFTPERTNTKNSVLNGIKEGK